MTILQLAESFGLTEDGALKGTTNEAHRRLTPARAKALAEASELWGKAWGGDRLAALLVNEALTTSDLFVSATGDLLDRELLASYGDQAKTWTEYATPSTVRNFKPKKLIDIMGGRTRLDLVPERTEYPGAEHSTNEFSISVKKFGRRFGYSWEASINDDIDELRQIPGRFAEAASLTEDYAALEALVTSSTGAPLASYFKSYDATAAGALGYAAFDNSSTAALTSAAVQAGIESISTRRDDEGNLLPVGGGIVLMVGPALQFTAERILNATMVRTTSGSKSVDEPNPLKGKVRLVVNPLLVGLAWFLLPDPRSARPALAVARLAGFDTPDLRVASNTGKRVGGGDVDPGEGDFDTDSVYYRVRHVAGGAALDPIHTYGSTGATGTPGV
jgi:hypothetical protein